LLKYYFKLLTERVYPAAAFEQKPLSGSKAFGYLNYARNEQAKSKGFFIFIILKCWLLFVSFI